MALFRSQLVILDSLLFVDIHTTALLITLSCEHGIAIQEIKYAQILSTTSKVFIKEAKR